MMQMESRIYHVVRLDDDSWQVLREGFQRPHVIRGTKAEAVLMAKRLAKAGRRARVIVHGQGDTIEREYNYTAQTE